MTNKEAIAILENLKTQGKAFFSQRLALDLAIKALEDRPQGEWIKEDEVHSKCSRCGFKYADYRILFNFCPNCRADMRGEAENEI